MTYTISDASGADGSAYDYLSISDLKAYLNVDASTDDSLMTDIRDSVARNLEIETGQSLKDNDIVVEFYGDDGYMALPFLPVTTLTQVSYIATDESSGVIDEASGDFNIFGIEGARNGDYVLQIPAGKYHKVRVEYNSNGSSPPTEFKLASMALGKVIYNDERDFDGSISKAKYPRDTIHLVNKYKKIYI